MKLKYFFPLVFGMGALAYAVTGVPEKKEEEITPTISLVAAIAIDAPLHYDGFITASRVDLNAYYFFVIDEAHTSSACSSAVKNALTSLSLENRIAAVYLPEFRREQHIYAEALPMPYDALVVENPALQFSGWQDDLTPGLNGTIYNCNSTPTESVFFNPMGDATVARAHWKTNGYAVVAPLELFDSFTSLANSKEVRPMMQVYTCKSDITASPSYPNAKIYECKNSFELTSSPSPN